ncbi:cation:proton antiporter [Rubrivirga sp. IMCC45206]|uniref:cation:proton antiporter domain-containing protein n=1 Tax=Rubrivirga sp. IMCC45206 TaxID=3391614 RepID=UPI00398FD7D6
MLALAFDLPLVDPVAVFTAVLLVLLAAPLIARRSVPSAVVLLAAGVALGPHALGVLDRDPTMVLLGTVGLLYILFLSGLEVDLHEFIQHRRQSLVLGGLTFLLPQTVGIGLGRLAFGMGWPAAVLLGSVFASHTLLAYPSVARLGLQRERAVTASIGATILTDTLALLVLAVVATGARTGEGADPAVVLRVVGALAVFGGAVLWGVPRLGAWFLRRVAPDATTEFVFVLATVFVCALGVEAVGVEPIIGAFLAGLALNRLVPEGSALMNRVAFVGNALFVPFFLLSTGMLVDLSAFAGGPDAARSWTVAVGMVATVLLMKGAAAWASGRALGFSADEIRLVFGLTVPQAAATLAAVLVGVQVGLFDEAVLNGTIAMVFVTCLVGPWVAEVAGRRVSAASKARVSAAPARSRLLVSLSNPATVGPLVDLALLAREPDATEPLVAVTVVGGETDRDAAVARGEQLLSVAVVHAAGAAVPVLPLVRSESNVARALARAAAETRATTLVVGWDGSAAAARLLFGSVPDRVLRETSAAVLVARGAGPMGAVTRLLVAVPPLADREPGFAGAARLLSALAARAGASVTVLSTDPAPVAAFARRSGPPPTPLSLADWADLEHALAAEARPGDALAVVAAREGSVAWRPGLDRLPHALAHAHPDRPLLVLYPGQPPAAAIRPGGLGVREQAFLDGFQPDHVRLALAPGSVSRLLEQVLGDAVDAGARADVLAGLAAAPLAALRPGVVLAHARTEAVARPVLAVGVGDGLDLGADGPTVLVAVLVVPAGTPTATYLRWLALVARMVCDDATLDAVRRASTPADARDALVASIQTEGHPSLEGLRGGV